MSDLRDELLALTADVRALLGDAVARGVRHESADAAPLPVAPVPQAPVSTLPVPAPEADDFEPPPAVFRPPSLDRWAAEAQRAREAAVPVHHDDGQGAPGLARIRADLGDCQRCGLCAGRTQIVCGTGDADADLMFIGEGPGEQEDLRGEPFVGPAGEMLTAMIEKVVGLPRPQVYIANLVKCRPPGNRNPAPDESAACKPFLLRQIQAVQPRLIVLLGGVALENLLGTKGILRARGTEVSFHGIPVIPTLHPAYLLRKPEDKKLAFEDLKQIRKRYDALGGKR